MSQSSVGPLLNQSPVPGADLSAQNDPIVGTIPDLIAAQATIWPDAIAAVHGKAMLTYKELNQRADLLAGFLQSVGVGPDVVVAIHFNRSLAMLVAALGIMKAGGAYLPLDPSYPTERLAFILTNAQAPVLVTSECLLKALPARPEKTVTLDPNGKLKGDAAARPVAVKVEDYNLAYLIYTSGSTGQPKGVEVTHGGLGNLISWHRRAFQVTNADRASQLASLGFDAAVWEVWPYLAAGARIHLADAVAINEPAAVRDWLLSEGITISFLSTPLAEQVIMLDWPVKTSLRFLLTGADTLHHYPSRKLPFVLVNNYGPTECAVVATSGTVLPDEHPDRLPSIGRPIDHVQIHILNEQMQQVPAGESGEVYIGGAGLARGYRNRPDLTAERFVRNPFGVDSAQRLYRTGDLGRYLPDGQVEFLGRVDEQIKIRGFRIEPAEIVKVLDEHPGVRASMAVAREIVSGDKRLIAYFVPAAKPTPTHLELRNFIASRLPEYMVPAAFVKLCAMPLNSSGKVDRAALPAPTAENTLRDDTFVAPRTPVEERLVSMLAPLLGLDKVSVEDNFFLLGGHSLLGTQLIARVRDSFGVELTLRALFDAPTIASLAAQVESLLLAKLEAMSEADAERLLALTTPART
ncbi:MAG TPA: non-ribosomal peptide synthetase [Candidatus Angelobacter sp.]|nr:non-ribosomal peptide synthetase [Candidatus Angelobacter sp.]